MPFFFIGFAWILCLLVGFILLCFRRLRFLACYIIFGATGLTFLSFAFSTLVLLGIEKVPRTFISSGLVAMVVYFGAIVSGGGVGALLGLIFAHKINRRFRFYG